MSGPPVVATIDGWTLTRYEYDGAPLSAAPSNQRRHEIDSVDVDEAGDLTLDVRVGGYMGCSHSLRIPRAVLVALIRDAIARGVITAEEITTP